MKTGTLEVYKIFSDFIGEDRAEKVMDYIKAVNETEAALRFDRRVENLATREDLVKVQGGLETKIAQVEGRLETKMVQNKAETIKWMFIFWGPQTLTILGLLAYFLKQAQ